MTVYSKVKVVGSYIAAVFRIVGPYLMVVAITLGVLVGVNQRALRDQRTADNRENDMTQVLTQRATCQFGNQGRADTRIKDVAIQVAVQDAVYRTIGERYFQLSALEAAEVGQVAANAAAAAAAEQTSNLTAPDRDCVAIYAPPAGVSEEEIQAFAAANGQGG